jgi:hypothetical protein
VIEVDLDRCPGFQLQSSCAFGRADSEELGGRENATQAGLAARDPFDLA